MVTRKGTPNTWAIIMMERSLAKNHRGILLELKEDDWEWCIEDSTGATVEQGTAKDKHMAMVACNRAAAKRGLVTSGSGVNKKVDVSGVSFTSPH